MSWNVCCHLLKIPIYEWLNQIMSGIMCFAIYWRTSLLQVPFGLQILPGNVFCYTILRKRIKRTLGPNGLSSNLYYNQANLRGCTCFAEYGYTYAFNKILSNYRNRIRHTSGPPVLQTCIKIRFCQGMCLCYLLKIATNAFNQIEPMCFAICWR